jgi:hypothetical protein
MDFKSAKASFFDAPKIVAAVDKATRNVLSRFGAFVRRTAKGSIRKAKSPSKPGKPPHSHVGLLKEFIFFSFDVESRSVVIGPTRLNQKSGSAPSVLEYGGTTSIVTRRNGRTSRRRVTIAERPYMNPALDKELPKLPAMWRDSVK